MPNGGSYKSVRSTNTGGEVHHIPAYGSYAENGLLTKNDGPAIWMSKDDHGETASWRSSKEARNYRAQQKELINQGKFQEAQQMDVEDIRSKFGDKYDVGLEEARSYTAENVDPSIFVNDQKPEVPLAESSHSQEGGQDKKKDVLTEPTKGTESQLKGDHGQKSKTLTPEVNPNNGQPDPPKEVIEDSKSQLKGDYGQKVKDSPHSTDNAEMPTESENNHA
jgi:hypothetical protein